MCVRHKIKTLTRLELVLGGPKQGLYQREICSTDDEKEIELKKKSQKSRHSTTDPPFNVKKRMMYTKIIRSI